MITSEVDLKPESKIEQAEFAAPAESTSACQADADIPYEKLYLTGRPTLKEFLRFVRKNALNPPDEGILHHRHLQALLMKPPPDAVILVAIDSARADHCHAVHVAQALLQFGFHQILYFFAHGCTCQLSVVGCQLSVRYELPRLTTDHEH